MAGKVRGELGKRLWACPLVLLVAVFSLAGMAQADPGHTPAVLWLEQYGNGTGRCVQPTSDGGYLLTGWTAGRSGSGSAVFLLKTDGQGRRVWEKRFSGGGYSCGYRVIQTRDGGALLVGDTKSAHGYDHDVYVVKTDARGNRLWKRTYGGPYCDYGAGVVETADGGFLVAGGTESYGSGIYDAYLLRLDGQGRKIWEKTYGGKGSDCGYALLPAADGGFVVAGESEYGLQGRPQVYLFKTDATGKLLWEKRYRGGGDSYGWALRQTADGGFIVAGETEVQWSDGGGFVSYLIKTDGDGNLLWERSYGGEGYSTAYGVCQTADGGYLLAGKRETAAGRHSLFLMKTDGLGKKLWERTVTGGSCAYGLEPTGDGGLVVIGEKWSQSDNSRTVLLLKLPPERDQRLWPQVVCIITLIPVLALIWFWKKMRAGVQDKGGQQVGYIA